jgi:hypothetical protein
MALAEERRDGSSCGVMAAVQLRAARLRGRGGGTTTSGVGAAREDGDSAEERRRRRRTTVRW